MLPEIGGGGDDGIALRPAERHRDHVGRDEVRSTDAQIEAGGDDVDQPALGYQIDMDFAMPAQERQNQRRHDLARACGESIDAQGSGWRGLLRADRVHRTVNVLQGRADLFEESAAGIGQGDAARRSVEQANAEVRLQLGHGIAQGCRGHAERQRSGAKRSLSRNRNNGGEVIEPGSVQRTNYPDLRDTTCQLIPLIGTHVHI